MSYAAAWVFDDMLRGGDSSDGDGESGATLMFATPRSRTVREHIHHDHPLLALMREQRAISITSEQTDYAELALVKGASDGSVTLVQVADVGVLQLVSASVERAQPRLLYQLLDVCKKLGISLRSGLAHDGLVAELEERKGTEARLRESERRLRQTVEAGTPGGRLLISV